VSNPAKASDPPLSPVGEYPATFLGYAKGKTNLKVRIDHAHRTAPQLPVALARLPHTSVQTTKRVSQGAAAAKKGSKVGAKGSAPALSASNSLTQPPHLGASASLSSFAAALAAILALLSAAAASSSASSSASFLAAEAM
jgi:hypothetical protein